METIELVLHHDVLCGWSWLADKRLRALADEFHGMVKIDYRPYPLRIDEMVPTDREREAEIKALRKVVPPLRIGSISLDLSFLIVMVAAYVLLSLNARLLLQ